jgi:hypothetical protein
MFENLSLKELKQIVKKYNLETKIVLSKVVDGKRKGLDKEELAIELHRHLQVKRNGDIIKKDDEFIRPVFVPTIRKKKEKAVKVEKEKEIIEEVKNEVEKVNDNKAKVINNKDKFYIYDNKGKNGVIDNLSNFYKLDNVEVFNNFNKLIEKTDETVLITWRYVNAGKDALTNFNIHLDDLKTDPEDYNLTIKNVFIPKKNTQRYIQIYVYRNNNFVGLVRADVRKTLLYIDLVFVFDTYTGKGYVGEMLSLLFEYLLHTNLYKTIDTVELTYASSSDSGWVAYDKGISRYGFNLVVPNLKYNNSKLTPEFIKKIHKQLKESIDKMEWNKIEKGKGMIRKEVEDIELII